MFQVVNGTPTLKRASLPTAAEPPKKKTRRVRIRRDKLGNIVQNCDVYIGRRFMMGGWNLPDSIWHNPYTLRSCNGDRDLCVEKFETYFREKKKDLHPRLPELRGKVLGCWCEPGQRCHGDVLIEMLNELYPEEENEDTRPAKTPKSL
jgi:hypothetical protein